MSEVKALIVAATRAAADLTMIEQHYRPNEVRHIDTMEKALGLRPKEGVRLLVNRGLYLRLTDYQIIEYLESHGFQSETIST